MYINIRKDTIDGKAKKPTVMETVSVRLPASMLAEIDDYIDEIKEEMPLLNIGRADGIRQLIDDGLKSRSLNKKKRKQG